MYEGMAETGAADLWYWDTGGDGEPVLLFHPASQSCQVWEHQRRAFAAAGLRVIAYSRRGHHKSPEGNPEQPGTSIGDALALLDYLNVAKAHVLGAAGGGIVAMGLAVAHPARVSKLIMAGTIFSPDEPDWRALYARLEIAKVRPHVSTEFLELGPAYRAGNPEGVARFKELAKLSSHHGPAKQPLGVRVDWPAMQRLQNPALLVTGEADLYAPPPIQELVARHLPNRRLATLPLVGHSPYWEAPEAFNRLCLDFLAE